MRIVYVCVPVYCTSLLQVQVQLCLVCASSLVAEKTASVHRIQCVCAQD